MKQKIGAIIICLLLVMMSLAQHPLKHYRDAIEVRYDSKQPVVNYILSIDTTDLSSFTVEIRLRNVADTFHVAMVAHPEYDDRYWRYIEDFSVETKNGKGKVFREDSALWKIVTKDNEAILHYRIHFPSLQGGMRSSWKAFLSSTGGLIGGPHSFMYVVGETLAPFYVSLKIPPDWQIATGLEATTDPYTFFAPSIDVLVDDPILVGKFKTWSFAVDGVPHRVVYLPLPDATVFDESKLISYIKKLVEQTSAFFGRLPYRDYTFMLQDRAFGALEHNNSVTVGAPSSQLATDLNGYISEIAHEYFHTWNLMRIHPIEYGDVSYKTPPLSKGLWFSEGLTIFYADLLRRLAGIPVFDSTRLTHLEALIRRYSGNPAYLKFSAEKISLASYGPPGMLGDYNAGTHLQGEVLGAMLDFIIRDATNGKRSMDDVMRKMLKQFSGEKGFTTKDIEQTITGICGCNVHQFFQDYVYGNKQIDFNKYLRLIGLQYNITWQDVLSDDGKPAPDLRVFSYQLPGETIPRIGITNPLSSWGRGGLHTGDVIKSVNGKPVTVAADFRPLIRNAKLGDTILIEIERPSGVRKTNVLIGSYQQPVVHISEIPVTTEKQHNLYMQWLSGKSAKL
jgi:predicted metalloprotease with PDZ domain